MKVLFITHRLPFAPNRGDRVRAFHMVRSLAERVDLEVLALAHDEGEMNEVDKVQALGVRARAFLVPKWLNRMRAVPRLLGTQPLTHLLLDAPGLHEALREIAATRPPDVVLAYCSSMARFAVEPPLDGIPFVLDMVDVDSRKWSELAMKASGPMRWIYRREARLLSAFESAASRKAQAVLVINDREQALLRELAPGVDVTVMPVGVDLEDFAPRTPAADGANVVFCGVMNYPPNVDGVLWFAREVWPIVRQQRPDARFLVVGSNPTHAIRHLASAGRSIAVTGTVHDVMPFLWNGAVSVAPLRTARGLQNKVLESLAAGLPTVVTRNVYEGLPDAVRPGCRVADTAEPFARHVLDWLAVPPAGRRAIAARADLSGLSWAAQLAPLYDILVEAAQKPT